MVEIQIHLTAKTINLFLLPFQRQPRRWVSVLGGAVLGSVPQASQREAPYFSDKDVIGRASDPKGAKEAEVS